MKYQIVGMVAEGVRVISDNQIQLVTWSDLITGHQLIENNQSFQLGMQVGLYIGSLKAANNS